MLDVYKLTGMHLRLELTTAMGCSRGFSYPVRVLDRLDDGRDNCVFVYKLMSYPTPLEISPNGDTAYQFTRIIACYSQGGKEVRWRADVNSFCHTDGKPGSFDWPIYSVCDEDNKEDISVSAEAIR